MTITPFILGILCCLASEVILMFLTACIGHLVEKKAQADIARKAVNTILEKGEPDERISE